MIITSLWLLHLLLGLAVTILAVCEVIRYHRLSTKTNRGNGHNVACPSVTVIVLSQDQESELRQSLPQLLLQNYEGEYHVIVSDMKSKDGTMDYLEGMEELYPMLSHTSIPVSARDISLQRLAMTLGVRSACTEWVVFTKSDCKALSPLWLSSLMAYCTDGKDAVLGFTKYDGCNGWTECKRQFFRFWQQMLWLPYSEKHTPYRAEDSLFAYRRSFFLQHNGFGRDGNLMDGAASLLVNHNISRGRCLAALSSESILTQAQPSHRLWTQDRVTFMETRRYLRHSFLYRMRYMLNSILPLLFVLHSIGMCVFNYRNHYALAALIASMFLPLFISIIGFRCAWKAFHIKGSMFFYPIMRLLIPLWDAIALARWCFTNKKTFRKKFV